jgi:predicted nucleic acid-binding protein
VAERLTLDANILVYSQDERDRRKHGIATELIGALRETNATLTTIAMGEFFTVLERKFMPAAQALSRVADFSLLAPVTHYEIRHILRAGAEVEAGRFSFWDAVMLACAEEAGCTICLSEDMSDGARLGRIVVKNPFGRRGLNEEVRAFLHHD